MKNPRNYKTKEDRAIARIGDIKQEVTYGFITSNSREVLDGVGLSVTIPSTATEISNGFNSIRLMDVTIPNSVVSIEAKAFENNLLRELFIPDSMLTIGEFAFTRNPLLKSVSVPFGKSGEWVRCFDSGVRIIERDGGLESIGIGSDS